MSPESSTCPYVVLKNKGLNLGGCALSTRMTCPRGGFGPAGRVGRRHQLAATGGGARPGHPPYRCPGTAGPARATPRSLTCSGAPDPGAGTGRPGRGVRGGRARPGETGGVPMAQVGQARAPARARPGSRGVQLGRSARARPGRGVLLSRMVARAPTGGAVWSPGARAAGRQKNKREAFAPLVA